MGHKQLTHKENEVTFNFEAVQGQIAGPLILDRRQILLLMLMFSMLFKEKKKG